VELRTPHPACVTGDPLLPKDDAPGDWWGLSADDASSGGGGACCCCGGGGGGNCCCRCDGVSAIKLFVGFDVDDHLIRELMRFIEMTCR
jgi:hypothetical protein